MEISKGSVDSQSRIIPYTFYEQSSESNSLSVIMPGLGYTTQGPLLRYSTQALFGKGFDVLQVNYNYSQEVIAALSEEEMMEDVKLVIETIMTKKKYANFCLLAKSIGTIPMAHLLRESAFQSAQSIWLTPLLKRNNVYQSLQNINANALMFIGDADPHYDLDMINTLHSNTLLSCAIYEGADHSLELPDDLIKSIHLLEDVIQKIQEF